MRNDTGVEEGSEISMYYDPMIAKLCTWDKTRELAIDAMCDALDQFELGGVGNNLQFLSAIMSHPRFREGRLTTAFIDEEYPDGFSDTDPDESLMQRFIAVAATLNHIEADFYSNSTNKTSVLAGQADDAGVVVRVSGQNTPVVVTVRPGNRYAVAMGESCAPTINIETDWQPGDSIATIKLDDTIVSVQVFKAVSGYELWHGGYQVQAQVMSARKAELASLMIAKEPEDLSRFLLCPMPGLVVALHVKEGDSVEAGQPLAVVEAMKMENVLQAEKSGVVGKVPVSVGDSLQVDEVIMEFE